MLPYRTAPDIWVCTTDGAAILLDSRRNRWLGLDPTQARALCGLVHAWPNPSGEIPAVTDDARRLARALADRGILVPVGARASEPTPRVPTAPTAELIPWHRMTAPLEWHHWMRFGRALLSAIFIRGVFPLPRIVRRYRARARVAVAGFDADRAARLVSAFQQLRPWFYARRERCLLDCLVLLEFLNSYGVTPQWVVGVRAKPFSSHSWVQAEHYVLSGTVAFVTGYAPILST